jgi:hypothetical protein
MGVIKETCQLPKEKNFVRYQVAELSPFFSNPGNIITLIIVIIKIKNIPPNHHFIQNFLLATNSICH